MGKTAGIFFKDLGNGQVEIIVSQTTNTGPAAALLRLALIGIQDVADIRQITTEITKTRGNCISRETVLPLTIDSVVELEDDIIANGVQSGGLPC